MRDREKDPRNTDQLIVSHLSAAGAHQNFITSEVEATPRARRITYLAAGASLLALEFLKAARKGTGRGIFCGAHPRECRVRLVFSERPAAAAE